MDDAGRKRDDPASNPFVAFRRFADEQMMSMVNSVFGIFQSSPIKRQQMIDKYEELLKQQEKGNSERLRQLADEDAHLEDFFAQAFKGQNNTAGGSQSEGCPYLDSRVSIMSKQIELLREHFSSMADDPESVFQEEYLRHSPYSPILLEQMPSVSKQSQIWRPAFEDLMHAIAGEEMPKREDKYDSLFLRNTHPHSWASYMKYQFQESVDRNILKRLAKLEEEKSKSRFAQESPVPLGQIWGNAHPDDGDGSDEERASRRMIHPLELTVFPKCGDLPPGEAESYYRKLAACLTGEDPEGVLEDDEDDEKEEDMECEESNGQQEMTELDLHERQSNTTSSMTISTRTTEDGDNTRPSVLSTLTTTETRTLPDGTKTTKVVLKKRFSDGVEESTERMFTENAPAQDTSTKSPSEQATKKTDNTSKRESGKKGWFWS